MSRFTSFASAWFFAATILAGQAIAAQPQTQAQVAAHKAFAQPPVNGSACMNNSRLVSHAAYLPVDPSQTLPCGHLLSTNTVLTVHHWDKT